MLGSATGKVKADSRPTGPGWQNPTRAIGPAEMVSFRHARIHSVPFIGMWVFSSWSGFPDSDNPVSQALAQRAGNRVGWLSRITAQCIDALFTIIDSLRVNHATSSPFDC